MGRHIGLPQPNHGNKTLQINLGANGICPDCGLTAFIYPKYIIGNIWDCPYVRNMDSDFRNVGLGAFDLLLWYLQKRQQRSRAGNGAGAFIVLCGLGDVRGFGHGTNNINSLCRVRDGFGIVEFGGDKERLKSCHCDEESNLYDTLVIARYEATCQTDARVFKLPLINHTDCFVPRNDR